MPAFINVYNWPIFSKNYASPIPHLLRSNVPPTGQELALVGEAVNNAKKMKAALERRINHSNINKPLFLSNYREKRAKRQLKALEEFITTHEARILPCGIMRLPTELLSIIFKLVTQEKPTDATGSSIVKMLLGSAFDLSHVCRLWRDVAVSIPHLWQEIPVLDISKAVWLNKRYLQCFEEVLRRGKDLPLIVMFQTYFNPIRTRGNSGHPAVKILVKHSERWRCLDIKVSDPRSIMPYLRPIKGKLSSLEFLNLHFDLNGQRSRTDNLPDCSIFEVAPNLRRVNLQDVSFHIALPTDGLLDLRFDGNPVPSIVGNTSLLSLNSSSIVSLTLSFADGSGHTLSPALLPCLLSLKVNFRISPSAWFLDNITGSPHVQDLELSTQLDEDLTFSAYGFIQRSQTRSLKTLSISQPLPPHGLLYILDYSPNLIQLDVPLPNSACILALCRTEPSGHPPLVPCLKSIKFAIAQVIQPPMIELLQGLAEVRYEYLNELNRQPGHHNQATIPPTGLDTLSISCPNKDSQRITHCALNGWEPPQILSPEFEEAAARLKEMMDMLAYRRRRGKKLENFTLARLQQIESDLHIVYGYDGLTASDLKACIEKVVRQIEEEREAFNFRYLAAQILAKWGRMIPHAYGAGRWSMSGWFWVHYGYPLTDAVLALPGRVNTPKRFKEIDISH
ncbi:hypothetical protein CPC08DRAFT_799569 [Agrocybe pediades]|nr:hypothetical protein CPC08DRAFT_799569 [Agrocybe pediades]